ncbi:hypothetical protein ABIE44_002608 [Marmoricola sp. OAE513]|uniref:hypothetical protein n=1 Tax=Marmoricola sp. OAE513 TaxID=2817894 RepID=UPI001AEB57CA
MRRPAALLVVAALSAALGCQGDSGSADGRATAGELRRTGLTLYLPDLTGLPGEAADTPGPGVVDADPSSGAGQSGEPLDAMPDSISVRAGAVVVTYRGEDGQDFRLVEQQAPSEPLCAAVEQIADSSCEESGGVMLSTMEELATLAVVRDGTLLVLRDVVVESRPGLVEALSAALRGAPVVPVEELAAIG